MKTPVAHPDGAQLPAYARARLPAIRESIEENFGGTMTGLPTRAIYVADRRIASRPGLRGKAFGRGKTQSMSLYA
jgi:hypothetical protein